MKYLIVVAHPDDEILGCLGTLTRLIRDGNEVVVQILSQRSKTRENGLKAKTEKIHKMIGISKTYFNDFEMMKFGKYDRYDLTRCIEKVIQKEQADIIITHDSNDIHNDHRILSQVVIEASKLPLRGNGYNKSIKGIYLTEIPSSTDWGWGFIPNAYFEIDEESLYLKEEYISEFENVVRESPHSRNYESFKALARYRGGQCGVMYAEAFRKIYEVNNV